MHFSNFSIRTKIGTGFAILVTIMVVLGALALAKLAAVNTNTQQIATNNLPSIQLASKMADLVQTIRRGEARHVMSSSEADMKVQDERIAATRKELADLEPKAAQVDEAVNQMDQATQQNAALVEQMAAAASSLKMQAGDLVRTVAVFKLDAMGGVAPARIGSSLPAHSNF
jgi:chromosome segregation ATPase